MTFLPSSQLVRSTVYDVDFTTLSNQSFGTDGNYTIDGKTWTVSNRTNASSFDIINSVGLRIFPNGSTSSYNNGTINAPNISVPILSLASGYDLDNTWVRVWIYGTDNVSQNYDSCQVGFNCEGFTGVDATNENYYVAKTFNSAVRPNSYWSIQRTFNSTTSGSPGSLPDQQFDVSVGENVWVLELRGREHVVAHSGVYSTDWPSETSLSLRYVLEPVGGENRPIIRYGSDVRFFLTAYNANTSGHVQFTIKRIRVELLKLTSVAGGGGGYTNIQDEGTPIAQRDTLDFQGAGVSVSDVGGKTIITIPGGGGYNQVIENQGTPVTQRTNVNFTGNVSVSDSGGKTVVNIPASYSNVMDEGVSLPQQSTIDFQGAGVTVTNDALNNKTVVTIPSWMSTLTAYDEGTLVGNSDKINFIGQGIAASVSGGQINVTVSSGTANTLAPLDGTGKVPYTNLPPVVSYAIAGTNAGLDNSIQFTGTGVVSVTNSLTAQYVVTLTKGYYNLLVGNGVTMTARDILEISGGYASVTDSTDRTIVNIPTPKYQTVSYSSSNFTDGTLLFTGAGVTVTSASNTTTVNIPGGGGSSFYQTFQDEGVNLTQRSTVDFQGAGVTATDNGSKTVVTVPGYYQQFQDEGTNLTQRTTVDFQGSGVTVSDNGTKTVVNIPATVTLYQASDKNYSYVKVPDTSTSSASFTQLTSTTITTSGKPIKVEFYLSCTKTNGGTVVARIKVDGTVVNTGSATNPVSGSSRISVPIIATVTGLAAGTHTVSVEWLVDANSVAINNSLSPYGDATTLYVEELISATGSDTPRLMPSDSYTNLQWALNETSSPWLNSGTSSTLNLTNTYGTPTSVVGLFDKALDFTSNSGVATSDTSTGETTGSWTVSCWVYLRAYTSSGNFICKKYQTGSTWTSPFVALDMSLTTSQNGEWAGSVTIGGTRYIATSSTYNYIPLSQWVHLAVTFDGSALRTYINGTLAATNSSMAASSSTDWGSHGSWQVGAVAAISAQAINGRIDGVRFESIARSQTYLELQYRYGVGYFDRLSVPSIVSGALTAQSTTLGSNISLTATPTFTTLGTVTASGTDFIVMAKATGITGNGSGSIHYRILVDGSEVNNMGGYEPIGTSELNGYGWTISFVGRTNGLSSGNHTFTFQAAMSMVSGSASTYTITPGTREGANLVVLATSPLTTGDKNYDYYTVPNTGVVQPTAWTPLTSRTITTYGRPLKIHFVLGVMSVTGVVTARIKLDGTEIGRCSTSASQGGQPFEYVATGLSAGSHTVAVEWNTSSGTNVEINSSTGNTGNTTSLYLEELVTPLTDLLVSYANLPASSNHGQKATITDGGTSFVYDGVGGTWHPVIGGIYCKTPPSAATFTTWVNQGTSTLTDSGRGTLTLTGVNDGASIITRGISIPTTNASMFIEACIKPNQPMASGSNPYTMYGVWMRETSTGKIRSLSINNDGQTFTSYLIDQVWASASSRSSFTSYHIGQINTTPLFIRMRRSGSTIFMEYCDDRYNWVTVTSFTQTASFTTAPTEVGICTVGVQAAPRCIIQHLDYL